MYQNVLYYIISKYKVVCVSVKALGIRLMVKEQRIITLFKRLCQLCIDQCDICSNEFESNYTTVSTS